MQNRNDLLVDDDGDLVIDATGDLDLATPLETVQQDIIFRLKTAHLDYSPSPFIGANLGSFKRHMNTRRTGDYMKSAVYESMTRDGRFSRDQIYVDVVPVSKTQVAVYVFVKDAIAGTEDEVYEKAAVPVVSATVDLDTGQITDITGGLR